MRSMTFRFAFVLLAATSLAACSADSTAPPAPTTNPSAALELFGLGAENSRYTGELVVRGDLAYVTTWGGYTRNGNFGNKINVWDVSGTVPVLVDSVVADLNTVGTQVQTIGDVAITDDGKYLVAATEYSGGSILIYDLADPRHPVLKKRYSTANTSPGVHTAEIGRVNGKLFGFLSIDPIQTLSVPARLVIVDLSDPTNPQEVYTKVIGTPYVHDTFLRDGILFLALWNAGIEIWDVGGAGKGGTPSSPVVLGGVKTVGGYAHNIWWYHDANGGKRYAFVGEEGPGTVGTSSSGDIHVLDVSDLTKPVEVAFYDVPGAGTHNFSVDEKKGVLYAAYYNAGVQAIDVTGNLASCAGAGTTTRCDISNRRIATGLTSLKSKIYTWGVQYLNGRVYASDMLDGLYVLGAAK